jgi:hypothetical protein
MHLHVDIQLIYFLRGLCYFRILINLYIAFLWTIHVTLCLFCMEIVKGCKRRAREVPRKEQD